MEKWAIAIFSSIHGGLGAGLEAGRDLGVSTAHLHTPPTGHRTPDQVGDMRQALQLLG